jgi:hypothetical protein
VELSRNYIKLVMLSEEREKDMKKIFFIIIILLIVCGAIAQEGTINHCYIIVSQYINPEEWNGDRVFSIDCEGNIRGINNRYIGRLNKKELQYMKYIYFKTGITQ